MKETHRGYIQREGIKMGVLRLSKSGPLQRDKGRKIMSCFSQCKNSSTVSLARFSPLEIQVIKVKR